MSVVSLVVPIVITVVLLTVALLGALSAFSASAVYRRLKRVPTRSIAQLEEGPAKLTGRARALEQPLVTLDGTKVLALRTEIATSHRSGSTTYRNSRAYDQTRVTRIEVTDASGSCELDPDHVIPLGAKKDTEWRAEDFAARFPDLWAALPGESAGRGDIIVVRTTETFVEDGTEVFVSGYVSGTSEAGAETDYRAARPRRRVRGAADHELIVSAWSEQVVARHALMPGILPASVALFAVSLVTVMWIMRSCIARVAGVE